MNINEKRSTPQEDSLSQFRRALIRRNKLRHAWRVLQAEGLPIPTALGPALYRAALEVEHLRGGEGEAA